MKSSDAQNALDGAMQDQACQWIARLRSESVSETDYQAFALWLASNPGHRVAMDSMLQLWGDLAVLEGALDNTPAIPGTDDRNRSRHGRRGWLAAGMSLVAGLCLAVLLLPQGSDDGTTSRYQTSIGETLDLSLGDGSEIKLNTNTLLQVAFSTRQRSLQLTQGEAYFRVARDVERPFVVLAGDVEVRALGTAFNIYVHDATSVVTVTEGVVRVTELNPPASRPAQVELLYSEQRLASADGTLGQTVAVDLDAQLAWRDGKLVAEGMPLAVLVEELSRYHASRIFIAEPGLAGKTVSGVFTLEDLDGILVALEHTAEVRSVELEDGSIQLIRAPL